MTEPSKIDKEQARAEFAKLSERTGALNAEAYRHSADNTFTEGFGRELQGQIIEISARLAEVRKAFWPQVEDIAALLKVDGEDRLLTANDYKRNMPNLKVEIAPEGPLPLNIVEILNRQSPAHEAGVLVKERHILAWVPDNLSLSMLSEALGGQKGEVLFNDWFTNDQDPLGNITLNAVEKSGHWALIPDQFPKGTESKGIIDSAQALKGLYPESYIQPDVISFTAPLLLHALKNNYRLYKDTWAWCSDPREGTHLFDENHCFGGGCSRALRVGYFDANGLWVLQVTPGYVDSSLGCAAVWNFGTWDLES